MVMTNSRYITPTAERYIQRSQTRLMLIKEQRERQRRREMASSIVFIGIGLAFVIGLFVLVANTGNLTNLDAGFSGSFERLLSNR